MSQLQEILKDLEEKASKITQDIQQSAANHNYLLGQADAVKMLIDWATKAIAAYGVDTPLAEGLEVVDAIVDEEKS